MRSLAEVVADLDRLGPDDHLAIDTETTGLDLYAGDVIRGVSVAYRPDGGDITSAYFPISHPHSNNLTENERALLVDTLHRTRATHDYWNRNFDAASLAQIGLEPRTGEAWDDWSFVAWLQNENDSSKLKEQGQHWLGYDAGEEKRALDKIMAGYRVPDLYARIRPGIRKGFTKVGHQWASERAAASRKTWGTLTYDDIELYARKDTDLTLRLGELQRTPGFLNPVTDLWPAYPYRKRFAEVVYRMIELGVKVDLDRTHDLAMEYNARIAEIEPEFGGINLNSHPQLRKLIFDEWGLEPMHYTKSGAPSTDKDTLAELEGSHPGIDLLLEHRALAKMVGTYLNPMSTWADEHDRVHSSLNIIGTVTGRLSSSHPNMQNIPKNSTDNTVKKLYVPSDGYELWEFDLHSAELFVGASIANDLDMQAALSEPGRNFHKETALGLFGSGDEPFYTLAKNLNYGIPYGIGPAKFAVYLVKGLRKRMSRELVQQAKTIIDGHKRLWPVTHRAMKKTMRFAEREGYLPMVVPGRFRHFDGWATSVPAYTAWNSAVQGGVAEIMVMWMVEAEAPLAELGARMVLQVHDSLWIEVPPGMQEQVHLLLQSILDDVNPVTMRLTIDAKRLN